MSAPNVAKTFSLLCRVLDLNNTRRPKTIAANPTTMLRSSSTKRKIAAGMVKRSVGVLCKNKNNIAPTGAKAKMTGIYPNSEKSASLKDHKANLWGVPWVF